MTDWPGGSRYEARIVWAAEELMSAGIDEDRAYVLASAIIDRIDAELAWRGEWVQS